MKSWLVTAQITEDVCIAERQGAGNEYLTLDYIPGTTWWGALAAETGIQPGQECDSLTGDDLFRRIFYSDDVLFSNLYPEQSGQRALPIPLSARTSKRAPGFKPFRKDPTPEPIYRHSQSPAEDLYAGGVFDWLRDGAPTQYEPDIEPLSGWYVGVPPYCECVSTRLVMRGHSDNSDASGTSREGRLFTRQNLSRGTKFIGALRAVTPDAITAAERFVETFIIGDSVEVNVGRQPGRVHLTLEDWRDEPLKWQPPVPESDSLLTVTLLSDAVLLDPWLRPLQALPVEHVEAALCSKVAVEGIAASFSRVTQMAGWNGAYALPRESDTVIKAGSAFLYFLDWPVGVSANERARLLTEWQSRGIGLRRAEGFGEIRLNDPFHTAFIAKEGQP